MARGQQAGRRARRRRGRLRVPPRLAAQDARERAGPGCRGPRSTAAAARRSSSRRSSTRRSCAPARPRRRTCSGLADGRADGHRARHRRAEAALPRADPVRRGDLVPGLLRARLRLGPRVAEDARGARGRRVGGHRPEGLDHARAPLQVVHARRAHRQRRAQAPGPHLLPDGHGAARGADPAAACRSPARRSSTSSSSRARASRTRTSSAGRATAGPWRSRRSCTSARRSPSGSRSRSRSRCASSWRRRARLERTAAWPARTRSCASAWPSSTSSPRCCA